MAVTQCGDATDKNHLLGLKADLVCDDDLIHNDKILYLPI